MQNYLGRETETELFFKVTDYMNIRIDEFDYKTNNAIEIDGAWCHDPLKDSWRDYNLEKLMKII